MRLWKKFISSVASTRSSRGDAEAPRIAANIAKLPELVTTN
jgi:hypothetical protein